MRLFGGPAPRTLALDDEAAVFDALRQADAIELDVGELRRLFDWYSHVPPDGEALRSDAVRQACAELMGNFSLRRITVAQPGADAVHFGDGA